MTSLKLLALLLGVALFNFPFGKCQLPMQACTALLQLDAGQQAAVDVGRLLPTGTFRALSVRFCTTDAVLIQIWTVTGSSSVQLKWQTSFTPTLSQTSQQYITVPIPAQNSLTISSQDRLGLYSYTPGSNWTKVAVPYSVDGLNGALYLTQSRYTSASAFTTGLQATLSNIQLKRTFYQFVRFCVNADCSDQAAGVVPSAPAYPLPSCGCPMSCSPDLSLTTSISQQGALTKYLQDQINIMQTLIQALLSSTQQTGYCPTGMTSGPYGDGYCYAVITDFLMTQELAEMECELVYEAELLFIDNDMEEQFLYNFLLSYVTDFDSSTGIVSFWTGGLYSFEKGEWVWSSQTIGHESKSIIEDGYEAFVDHDYPKPPNPEDGCLAITINFKNHTSYWNPEHCYTAEHYPVCKAKKLCL